MKLSEYVADRGHGSIQWLAKRSGVSATTIGSAARGHIKIKRFDVAKAISDATGGAVTVEDLCTPDGDASPGEA